MTRALEVTTLGEPFVGLIAEQPGGWLGTSSFRAHVVGAELNLATGLARLGHAVAYIGAVGDDDPGRLVEGHLGAEGIDAQHVRRTCDEATALLVRDRRAFGPAQVSYRRKGSAGATLCPEDIARAVDTISATRWMHVTGVTPALSGTCRAAFEGAVESARAVGASVSLDVNHRSQLWSEQEARACLRPIAGRCTVVFGDDAELQTLTGRADPRGAVDALLALGVEQVVRKLGAQGAMTIRADGRVERAGGHAVTPVVDPVGAGDAFASGYLSALLDGGEPMDALRRGNLCGAFAVSAVGDSTALPDRVRLAAAERHHRQDHADPQQEWR